MPIRSMRKACDACSLRKVQCDGRQPCRRCMVSSFDCTYLKSRAKPGPKGPRKATAEAIHTLQTEAYVNMLQAQDNPADGWLPSAELRDAPCVSMYHSDHSQEGSLAGDEKWTQNFPGPSSYGVAQAPAPCRIPTSSIAHQLTIFESRAYSIWPVVDAGSIIDRLYSDSEDLEAYALATALCAASISQFQHSYENSADSGTATIAGHFELEAKRARLCYDHQERMTMWSLLTSFFLHVYAANIGKKSTSTLLLSEAVTVAHVIGLHKKIYYNDLDEDQQQYNLRVYWLLFITERAHALQNEMPTTLRRAPDLPSLQHQNEGSNLENFIQLCTLFHTLDETVNNTFPQIPTRIAVAAAQKQISQGLCSSTEEDNEIQRADLHLTQQWMRLCLWQHSLSLTNLVSDDPSQEFSLCFPAQVAKTALGFVSSLSRESIEAHGPGMETKLFEITNALADVMICVPSVMNDGYLGFGNNDVIRELCVLLASFRGGNPTVVSVLREKLTNSSLMVSSPAGFIVHQSLDEDDENRGVDEMSWGASDPPHSDSTVAAETIYDQI